MFDVMSIFIDGKNKRLHYLYIQKKKVANMNAKKYERTNSPISKKKRLARNVEDGESLSKRKIHRKVSVDWGKEKIYLRPA